MSPVGLHQPSERRRGVQKLIIDQIGETLPYLNQAPALFAAGIVGVLICGPLMRAIESYKKTDP